MKVYALEKTGTQLAAPWSNYARAISTLFVLSFFAFISIRSLIPPEAVPASAPLSAFSSARSMQHLRAIAQEPHPSGSPAHGAVRDYIYQEIMRCGLSPEAQNTSAVTNIIATLKGIENNKAILLVGHYDTVPTSPGASDDGAAVSSMLETLRALKDGPPLKNDVIFLFTDGEEKGLLGAKAFAYKHPSASDIGAVLNFEARGNSGPSIMFKTSDQNGWIIKEFAKAVNYPVAASFTADIYKLLPHDTDFTVFRTQGFEGLNFAYIKGAAYYHTPLDDINNIDERSLQHHGDNALSLARNLNLNLEHPREGNFVYFNVPGQTLLFYSYKWVIPLAIFLSALFVMVTILGFRRKVLNLKEIGLGLIALPSSMIITAILVTLVSDIVGRVRGVNLFVDPHNEVTYITGIIVLIILIVSILRVRFRRLIEIRNLTFAVMTWALLLTIVTSFLIPGASYLFAWPLLFGLLGLALTFASKDSHHASVSTAFALSICSIPAIVLFIPTIYILFIGLTLKMAPVVSAVVVFLQSLLIQQFDIIFRPIKWVLPRTVAAI